MKKQTVAKVSVRYDARAKAWAVLKDTKTMESINLFPYGVMKNVKFSTHEVTELVRIGCGSSYTKSLVGVATGERFIGFEEKSMRGAKNLKFGDSGCLD